MNSLKDFVTGHPVFSGLSREHLGRLAACGSEVRFAAGRLVFRQGEPADRCYLIRVGQVALEVPSPSGGRVVIQTLEANEVLGWSWLFPPYVWHFDARARLETEAVALDGPCVRSRCDEDPPLGYELMKRFSAIMHQRMQAARLQTLDLYGPNSE